MSVRTAARRFALAAALAAALAVASPGWAQEEAATKPEVLDRWGFTVGDYLFNVGTDIRWDLAGEPGTDIDWEDDLGFDTNKNTFRIDGYYRFNRKHRLDFQFFAFNRSADKMIEDEIIWGGVTYPVGAYVEAKAGVDFLQLMYGYSFFNEAKWELGLAGGLSAIRFKAQLHGEAWVDDQQVEYDTEKKSVTAPAPVIGPYLEWHISKHFDLLTHWYFFTAEFDKYDADIANLAVGLDWYITDMFGLGVRYSYQTWKVGVEDNGTLDADYSIDGWHAYMAFKF